VTKTAENTFRDLQIAAINELALYCEAMGINVYDVRTGVDSLKGEGITRAMLWPGAGVGGHCLTKDTYHLERGVQVLGNGLLDYPAGEPSLYVLARRINDFMPAHMSRLTIDGLKRAGVSPKGAKIALLGWAFLSNSDDSRNTPAEPYRDLLLKEGSVVAVHDPYVAEYPGVTFEPFVEEALRNADAIVIFAGHHQYRTLDPAYIRNLSGKKHPVIVDGRNLIDADAYIRAGFIYKGIGRGDRNSHAIAE
jgi:UDP-N-acetyl-D-mannosaminuronic acid dehydrogenase